jgi:hypothetical protein
MGQKGSQTTTSQSSSSPPPQVMADYQGLVNRATNAANTPYQQYPGELVAPLSTQTQQGLGQVAQYAGAAQPFYNAAAGATMAAATPVSPTQFSPGQVGQYMNPYTQSVIDATQAQFNNQNQQAGQFLNSQNISSGAFGGDRAGVSQAILANQQQTAQAPVIAGLYNQNYNQALSEFNTQQGVGLQAQAFNNQQLGQMANQLSGIGTASQAAGLQGAQANLQAGIIPQQEQQQIDTSLYNQYLQQQAYPFQTTGWLGNIVEGTGSLSGGTGQSSTTTPVGSPISQGLGMAQSGLGILGNLMTMSDREAKENIKAVGKTFDGQTIYRFNYKGDPRTQIGLIAQETAKTHPEAVGQHDGLRTVNYGVATADAARRGHFANGGAPPQGQPQPSMINYPTTAQQPSSTRFPTVGQQAYTMGALGDPGARAGMGALGLITGRAPMMSMQGMGGAQGGSTPLNLRQGFQVGGVLDAQGDLNSYDPTTNYLNPQAGIANTLFDAETAGDKNPQEGVDLGVAQAIGTGAPNLATPYTQVPGPAQNYPAIDWQNPGNDFQTAGAEASLQGLIGRPGVETSPSESSPPTSALSPAGGSTGASSGGGGQVTGGASLPSSLAAGLANWASGSPTAFGGTGVPGVSGAMPGTMQGVSVGDRMGAGPTAAAAMGAPGAGGVGGATPGGNGVTMANPPRAAVSAPSAAGPSGPTGDVGQWAVINQMLNDQGLAASRDMAAQQQSGGRGGSNSPGGGMSISDVINARAMNNAAYGLPQSDPSGAVFTPASAAAYLAPAGKWRGGPARIYRAAGGMLGQSGMPAALEQPPQGSMVSGPGQGALGSPGFNNMFGGGGGLRQTFADGGGASMNPAIGSDPFSEVVSWVPGVSNQITGHGPPQAPSSTPPPSGGGASPQKSPADAAKGLSDAIAGLVKGHGDAPGTSTAGPGSDGSNINPDDASNILSGADLSGDFNALADDTFDNSDAPVGGGIGMMSRGGRTRRGHFASGGADDSDAPVILADAGPNYGGPDAKTSTGATVKTDSEGRAIDTTTGAPTATLPQTPAPVAAPPAAKTAPVVKAPAAAPPRPDPVVSSPTAISRAIDSLWDDSDGASPSGGGGQPVSSGSLSGPMGLVAQVETGNRDIPQRIHDANTDRGTPAQGNFQIIDPTWRRYAPVAGIDLNKYPTALGAPFEVQSAVASVIPVNQWGDHTKAALLARYPGLDVNKTLGEAQAQFGGANAPTADAGEAGQSGSVDPNTLVAPVVGGNRYFTAKDYADPNSSKREFFNALMYGGFAMMGGESRNPWVNIGRGEMAGMDYYQKQQGLDRDWIEKQAQIDHLSADDRRADADVNLRNQQMQIEAMKIKYALDAANARSDIDKKYDGSGGAPAPAPAPAPSPAAAAPAAPSPSAAAHIGSPGEGTSPVNIVTPQGPAAYPALGPPPAAAAATPGAPPRAAAAAASPNVAAPEAQPVADVGPDGKPTANWWNDNVAREDNPNYWLELAASDDRKSVFDPTAATRAQEERRIASELSTKATVRGKDGSILTVPGAQEAAARGAGLTAQAEEQGRSAATPIEPYVFQNGQWVKMRVMDPADIAEVTQRGTLHGMPTNMAEPPALAGATAGAQTSAQETEKAKRDLVDVQDQPGGPTYKVTKQQLLDDLQSGKRNPAQYPAFISDAQKELVTKTEPAMLEANHARVAVRNQLETMQDIMQKFQPGAFSQEKGEIVAALRAAGINVPNSATANPGAFQEFSKLTMRQVMDQVKTMGGRPLVSEINGFQKAVANPEMQPEAAAMVISQAIGVVDRENQFYKDYTAWKAKNPWAYSPNQFEQQWDEAHPLSDFISQDSKNFAYKGQYVPEKPEERLDGQLYQSPKDGKNYRWNKQAGRFMPG